MVSSFIVQAFRGEPIAVNGGGSQTRSFCFFDDLIGGHRLIHEQSREPCTRPLNLENPDELTHGRFAIAPLRFILTDAVHPPEAAGAPE